MWRNNEKQKKTQILYWNEWIHSGGNHLPWSRTWWDRRTWPRRRCRSRTPRKSRTSYSRIRLGTNNETVPINKWKLAGLRRGNPQTRSICELVIGHGQKARLGRTDHSSPRGIVAWLFAGRSRAIPRTSRQFTRPTKNCLNRLNCLRRRASLCFRFRDIPSASTRLRGSTPPPLRLPQCHHLADVQAGINKDSRRWYLHNCIRFGEGAREGLSGPCVVVNARAGIRWLRTSTSEGTGRKTSALPLPWGGNGATVTIETGFAAK